MDMDIICNNFLCGFYFIGETTLLDIPLKSTNIHIEVAATSLGTVGENLIKIENNHDGN